jgi:hypothetical protein
MKYVLLYRIELQNVMRPSTKHNLKLTQNTKQRNAQFFN